MKFVELFAGIGGLGLGLERAGHEVILQCEIDDWCRRVLAKHWPDVPRIADVHDVTAADCEGADMIVGGFPCQPVSVGGKRLGNDDPRWLWPAFARLIREADPQYVLIENVVGLLSRGISEVVGDLRAAGYVVYRPWQLSAAGIGAPHRRDRIFIVAHADGARAPRLVTGRDPSADGGPWDWRGARDLRGIYDAPFERGDRWPQPLIRGVDDGIPERVDRVQRLTALGNAVVPQVAEEIGRRLPLAL